MLTIFADFSAKVKEDKKEKTTPTKKSKKSGTIDKSLISGPVRSYSNNQL